MTRARYFLVVFSLACVLGLSVPREAYAQTALEGERAQLQAQLDQIEKDIEENRGVLKEKQAERASLERDMSVLNAKIKTAQLAIKKTDLTLSTLETEIVQKQASIGQVDAKLTKGQQSLAQLLRRTREIDEMSVIEIALNGSFTELFNEIDAFATIQSSLQDAFDELANLRGDLAVKKIALEEKQSDASDMRSLQVVEKRAIERQQSERNELLASTKGQEKAYQAYIKDREKQAAKIRAALFGLRDSGAIPFGTAYAYAKEASSITGVRPAVILAILREESGLGENVGTGNWQVDMHPTRDRPVFAEITAELGINPDTQPVSKKPWYGWGGAMGPAQFIPSTWVQYKDRIAKLVGQSPPNPWDGRTAIFATALLMADNGADEQTRASERLAALRYLAGWGNAKKPAYAFYGDDVMSFADEFQRDIDILGN